MSKFTITGHMIVKNEECYVWYAIMSVIDFVDKLIIYDTGSTDNTVQVIESIVNNKEYKEKIYFEEKGNIDKKKIYSIRQEQINRTETDYFFIIDGDEIWYKDSLRKIKDKLMLTSGNVKLVWVEFYTPGGDIYHGRAPFRESYHMEIKDSLGNILKEAQGPYTIRLYSMDIPGIHCSGEYGVEGFFDENGVEVQKGPYSSAFIEKGYFHCSYLNRAGNKTGDLDIPYRAAKNKKIWDYEFANGFKYPEVFYLSNLATIQIYNPFVHKIGWIDYIYHYTRKIYCWIKG